MEYHANGGGGSWHANRRTSGQLSFEGSWILLLNNNGREPVMLNYAGDAGDGFTQDVAAAYPLIWSGGRRN